MDTLSVFVTLLLIMDPFGNIPVFLPILERIPEERRRKVLVRELFLALAVIVLAVFCGNAVMSFLGLREQSVSIAGGIILFLIALRMVFPTRAGQPLDEFDGEPFLVPLAIPLIAGPSLLAVLLLFATGSEASLWQLLLAAILAWLAVFLILFSSTFLYKVLSRRGLVALERLMGMVLIALAVQLFLDGLAGQLGG